MEYRHNVSLSEEEVRNILIQCDRNFSLPRWGDGILKRYAKKISQFACKDILIDNDEVLGFNMYYVNKETKVAFITIIAISENHRGRSLGTVLLSQMRANVKSVVSSICLEVRKDNAIALNFYKKHGFKEVGSTDIKLQMELSLI